MSKQQQGKNRSSGGESDFKEAIEGEVEVLETLPRHASTPRLPLLLAGLALVVVSAALLFGYRYWMEMKATLEQLDLALVEANQQQSQFAERLQQSRQAIDQQQQQIATQKDQLAQQAERIKQAKESAQQQGSQLYRSLSEIQTRMGGREGQWRVAEAEYLMRVANHRLALMGDAETALEALKSADERLVASGDPAWSGVREQLAREITRLKAVPEIDIAGINAELSALSDQVSRLPLRDEGITLVSTSQRVAKDPAEADQQGFTITRIVDDLWQGFKSMMVIRHHDRPVSAMLPPEQRYFLIQNLRLKLETAKAAMMGRNKALYVDSLNASRQWVADYFLTGDPGVKGFNSQLQTLAARDVAPKLPDVSGSLRALQERRQQLSQEEGQ
jgi:uroporphyrin-3 C-methyltransferase